MKIPAEMSALLKNARAFLGKVRIPVLWLNFVRRRILSQAKDKTLCSEIEVVDSVPFWVSDHHLGWSLTCTNTY